MGGRRGLRRGHGITTEVFAAEDCTELLIMNLENTAAVPRLQNEYEIIVPRFPIVVGIERSESYQSTISSPFQQSFVPGYMVCISS